MEGVKCEFCNKSFKTASILKNHKQSAKYCLKIQKEKNPEEVKENFKKCEFCLKDFAYNVIKRHIEKCKTKIEKNDSYHLDKIKELEKENFLLKELVQELSNRLSELKGELNVYKKEHECLIDIAKQPKTTSSYITNNNNKILNITSTLDFNDTDKIKEVIENNYTIEYMLDGQKGFAKFAVENLLKDEEGNLKYICTDPSRQIFKYKDTLGDLQRDVEAKKLTNYLVDGGIKEKTLCITTNWCLEDEGKVDVDKLNTIIDKQNSLLNFKENNSLFKKELIAMTTI
jgi:hypothetical protein